MSAATVTPAAVLEEAHAVLHTALSAALPESRSGRIAVWTAVLRLDGTLRACRKVPGEGEAGRAAQSAEQLIRVMSRHCGPGWGGEL